MNRMQSARALTEKEQTELKQKLEEQRTAILANTKVLRLDFNVATDDRLDEVDLALSDSAQGMQMRLGNREGLYFKKIDEALLRIKEGTYGRCKECNSFIGARRLEARPTAELCIDCKESAERLENLSADGKKSKSLGKAINFKA
jgi:DnaK suppressor protein